MVAALKFRSHAVGVGVIAFASILAITAAAGFAADAPTEVAARTTSDGVRFATLGAKRVKPAPTLFVFATDTETSLSQEIYLKAGMVLGKQGWLCVSLDLPCHGAETREGEPGGLAGWRHRVDAGEDPMDDFANRCRRVLDYLVSEGWTDASRVAVCGTSRGGFSALHFAASDPRVQCVVGYAPLTDLKALQEFRGAEDAPLVRRLAIANYADKLANRAVWITIGSTDERVGTDLAIATARAITAAAVAGNLPHRVELHVLPAPGHTTPAGAVEQSAAFIAGALPPTSATESSP
jgi:dienelactone hydrolase